ncbi:MAG TPA: putative glycoside hydrolase [Acidimicrobiia bacterium]|nr:putative glycoside hydrolase [Acidimicrobiia bacterium]
MSRRTQFRLLVAFTIVWAVWAGWSLLGRATPYTLRVLDDSGAPIASAFVDVDGRQVGTSADDGLIEMEWNSSQTVLEVSAPGHVPLVLTIAEPPDDLVDAVLKARILRGKVVDSSGVPVESAHLVAGPASGLSDDEGEFTIRGAEPGTVLVTRPAWIDTSFVWDGGPGETSVELLPFAARAVHITGEAAASNLDTFIEMAETTELNALMLDLKDETGLVSYNSQNPIAGEVGAIRNLFDLTEVSRRAEEAGLYLIGRLVIFNDPTAAIRKPSMAVWDSATEAPFASRGQYFLDPTDADARAYAMGLAEEACAMGVDEIQFDYVRYPDARSETAVFDGGVTEDVRIATITSFFDEAIALLHPMGCAVGADVFGFTTRAEDDGGIGQRWPDILQIVDVASPMVYPSHYDTGWYGFDNPNDHPGPMVTNALQDGLERMPRNVVVRPWLQDFGYTSDQVRAQIESAEQYGLGWMLWNASSNVTTEALGPAE